MCRNHFAAFASCLLTGVLLALPGCARPERQKAASADQAADMPARAGIVSPAPASAAPAGLTAATGADTCRAGREAVAAQASAAAQPQAESKPAGEAGQEPVKEADLKKKRKEVRQQERKIVKLERELEVARLNLEKAKLAAEFAELRDAAGVAKAEFELELAERRLQTFTERTAPARIAWGELNLQRAEDGATEAREELDQLELMYREEEFADKTKEIVLERGRRRLERTLRDLELQRADFATLGEQTLPVERAEHEQAVVEKREALQRARENVRTGAIEQKVGLLNAEGEIMRLEHELADAREELADLRAELNALEEKAAQSRPAEERQE